MREHQSNMNILHEDEWLMVVRKPAGLMVEPDRNNHVNLLQLVKKYLGQRDAYAQHIHRLDRPVDGIVLFAKQRSVLKNLSEQFAQRQVVKRYRAYTVDAPAQRTGELIHWHRKEKKRAVLYEQEVAYSELASLAYTIEEITPSRYCWSITLNTGKYHQIRAQLAHVGCPIVGDATYGSAHPYREHAIALQAYQLIFSHPLSGQTIDIQIPPLSL